MVTLDGSGGAENSPYKYLGSHILPSTDGERAGQVFLSLIPDHVVRNRNAQGGGGEGGGEGDTGSSRIDLVRLTVDDGDRCVTVLLGRNHITEIYEALDAWLNEDRHW